MKKIAFQFGLLMVAVVILLKLSQYFWTVPGLGVELVIIVLAIIFVGVGYYLSRYFSRTSRDEYDRSLDKSKIEDLGISEREYEVLVAMSAGLSNMEVAKKLYISESTVKTHVSNLFIKLNSKRRTEAITKARELMILP